MNTDSGVQTVRQVLSEHVGSTVGRLQAGYLKDVSSSVASLAKLRRAISSPIGADAAVWAILFDGMPEPLRGRTDAPSKAEQATHAALTLYAIHQQGRERPMHRPGRSLGSAAGELARKLGQGRETSGFDQGVLRRFQALGTASTLTETLYHARGLVTQLRSGDVGLDYARFAQDLYLCQDGRQIDRVRLSWGRDFYRTHTQPTDDLAGPSQGEQS